MTGRGNPSIHLRIEPLLYAGLRAYAIAKNVSLPSLVRSIIIAFVKKVAEEKEGAQAIVRHVREDAAKLKLQVYSSALAQSARGMELSEEELKVSEAGVVTQDQHLHEAVYDILKSVVRLCESSEAAQVARVRIDAIHLASVIIRTDLAVLFHLPIDEIEPLLDELKAKIESLEQQLPSIPE